LVCNVVKQKTDGFVCGQQHAKGASKKKIGEKVISYRLNEALKRETSDELFACVLIIGIQKNVVGLVTLFYLESIDTSRTRIVL